MKEPYIPVSDYDYTLPEDRIARFPVDRRDDSKLVILKDGAISETVFSNINSRLPDDTLLIFNNTRVIHARLRFTTVKGASIEVFCLQAMADVILLRGSATWKCFIGNARKWKYGILQMEVPTPEGMVTLTAERGVAQGDAHLVHFKWNPSSLIFEQLLEYAGRIPLPPYIKREVVETDKERYQTVYARYNGSVAAPTAGLHFTPGLLDVLSEQGIQLEYLTLHVGAGTFKPVSAENATEHQMHAEEVLVGKSFLIRLIQSLHKSIIPVGTTSMRSVESLYWIGVSIIEGHEQELDLPFIINQWMPYEHEVNYPTAEALQAIVDYMNRHQLTTIRAVTSIMIVRGYHFRICNALITNFHQPKSTLLMLVAAFVGKDWKKVYDYALSHDFRFLSYGDSCLFFKKEGC